MGITNRVIADNDRSFQVSVGGFSRGHWSLVMEVLHQWLVENKSSGDAECVRTLQSILKALESHVVENNDGYTLSYSQQDPAPMTNLQTEALKNARMRRAEELKEMEEFEKEYKRAQRKNADQREQLCLHVQLRLS
jgi:hypothetical protein